MEEIKLPATIIADLNHPIHDEPSLRQASHVLFGALRPSLSEFGTARLSSKLNAESIGLVDLALQSDDSMSLRDILLLSNQEGVHIVVTERGLELYEIDGGLRLGVCEDSP